MLIISLSENEIATSKIIKKNFERAGAGAAAERAAGKMERAGARSQLCRRLAPSRLGHLLWSCQSRSHLYVGHSYQRCRLGLQLLRNV